MSDWRDAAACVGTDPLLFFDGRRIADAVAICMRCPVMDDCLDDDLAFAWKVDVIHGVRGGLTEEQRREMWRTKYPRRRAHDARWYYELVPA